jgi:hypothetical protein
MSDGRQKAACWIFLRSARKAAVFPCVWLLFLPPLANAADPDAFEASGHISITYGPGVEAPNRGLSFKARSNGKEWFIRCEPDEFKTNCASSMCEAFEASSDGTNVYSISIFNKQFDPQASHKRALDLLRIQEKQLVEANGDPAALLSLRGIIKSIQDSDSEEMKRYPVRNQAGGSIHLGLIPKFDQLDLIAPIWLALCSEKMFQSIPQGLSPAFFNDISTSPLAEVTNIFVPGSWELFSEGRKFPARVSFTNDGSFFGIAIGSSARKITLLKPKTHPPYRAALFEAGKSKQYGNFTLPESFSISIFSTGEEVSHALETELVFKIEAVVTNVSGGIITAPAPDQAVLATITDHRFVGELNAPVISYLIPSGGWVSKEQVRASPEFALAVSMAAKNARSQPGINGIPALLKGIPNPARWSLLFLILLLSILFWVASRKKAA